MSLKADLNELYLFALSKWGLPYIWGGEGNPGYDCSGFVQAVLRHGGLFPETDHTAHGIYNFFRRNGDRDTRERGSLAFYGPSKLKITHIGWCIDDQIMIHARGGDSSTNTVERARQRNAKVDITPIQYRRDLVECILPWYDLSWIQLSETSQSS